LLSTAVAQECAPGAACSSGNMLLQRKQATEKMSVDDADYDEEEQQTARSLDESLTGKKPSKPHPTPHPTHAPTPRPTPAPTEAPTPAPTEAPADEHEAGASKSGADDEYYYGSGGEDDDRRAALLERKSPSGVLKEAKDLIANIKKTTEGAALYADFTAHGVTDKMLTKAAIDIVKKENAGEDVSSADLRNILIKDHFSDDQAANVADYIEDLKVIANDVHGGSLLQAAKSLDGSLTGKKRPTPHPTHPPTPRPTPAPTDSPTPAPTEAPADDHEAGASKSGADDEYYYGSGGQDDDRRA